MKVKIGLVVGGLFALALILTQSQTLFPYMTCSSCWDDMATQEYCEEYCQIYVGQGCSYTIPTITWCNAHGQKCNIEFWSVCLNGYSFRRVMTVSCPFCPL